MLQPHSCLRLPRPIRTTPRARLASRSSKTTRTTHQRPHFLLHKPQIRISPSHQPFAPAAPHHPPPGPSTPPSLPAQPHFHTCPPFPPCPCRMPAPPLPPAHQTGSVRSPEPCDTRGRLHGTRASSSGIRHVSRMLLSLRPCIRPPYVADLQGPDGGYALCCPS